MGMHALSLGAVGIGYMSWQSKERLQQIDDAIARGDFLMGQGNEQRALEAYSHVAEMAPDRIEPWVKMASVHAAATRTQEAIPFYEKALGVDSDHFETRVGLAICKEGLGDFLSAEEHYKKAIEIRANYAEVYYNLGYLYQKQKLYESAAQQHTKRRLR